MYKHWTQEEIEKLVACAKVGMTVLAAADALGLPYPTVRYKAIKLRIRFSGQGGAPRKTDWQRAKELAEKGCWLSKAARILNIHHTTALYISRRMGFKWAPAPPLMTWYVPKPHVRIKPTFKYDPREDHEDAARIERMLEIAGRCA